MYDVVDHVSVWCHGSCELYGCEFKVILMDGGNIWLVGVNFGQFMVILMDG